MVVEQVDVFQGGDLDLFDGAPRSSGLDGFGLDSPITDSAKALSNASPIESTDGSIQAAVMGLGRLTTRLRRPERAD